MSLLLNPCKYSFQDLLSASAPQSGNKPLTLPKLYALSQEERNKTVKALCEKAGWFYQDVVGSDGVVYTAFSPFKKN